MSDISIDDDPRLKAAEEEAQRRFGEFEAAFFAHDGLHFAVKITLLRNGVNEHIWVEVERMRGGTITGTVANDPVHPEGLEIGEPVEVDRSQVKDWIVVRRGKPMGLFSVPIIEQIKAEESRKS